MLLVTTPKSRRRAEARRVAAAARLTAARLTTARLTAARLTAERRPGQEAREIYASELIDTYADTLFRIAWVTSADRTIASDAVTRVLVAASLDQARPEFSHPSLAELSRLTIWASLAQSTAAPAAAPAPHDPDTGADIAGDDGDDAGNEGGALRAIGYRERALIALTMYGDHDYREAAAVLEVAPETAADLLRSALLTLGEADGHGPPAPADNGPASAMSADHGTLEPMPETREAMAEFMTHDGPEIEEVLADLGRRARHVVPEVVGLSLGLVRQGVTFTLIASNSGLGALDATQYLDGGPCVEVTEARRDVVQFATDDPLDEGQWLLFAQSSAAMGVASSLSLPIFGEGRVIGGINLYASTADAFTGHHDELAAALGSSASVTVTNADLSFATRLQAARAPAHLRATQQIETATGLLAARYDLDLGLARARLRDAAARAGVDEALVAQLMTLVPHH